MPEDAKKGGLYRNAISFFGAYVAIVSVFLILFSLMLQFSFKAHSPYIGIFSFMVFPLFFTLGAILFLYGMRRGSIRRRRHGGHEALPPPPLPPHPPPGDGGRGGDGTASPPAGPPLLKPSISVPLVNRKLALGTWQQIVFLDFDNRERRREIIVQVIGE